MDLIYQIDIKNDIPIVLTNMKTLKRAHIRKGDRSVTIPYDKVKEVSEWLRKIENDRI